MLKGSYRRSLKYISLYGNQKREEESASCQEERAKHPSLLHTRLHRTRGALARPQPSAKGGGCWPHAATQHVSSNTRKAGDTLSWPSLPLRLESQSPLRLYSIGSGHFRTSVTGWAQRLQASCRLRGGCQERSLACRYTAVVPVLLFSARQIGTTRLSAANK